MIVQGKSCEKIVITSESGIRFVLKDKNDRIEVTKPNGDRVMYQTDQGYNNAEFVVLVK